MTDDWGFAVSEPSAPATPQRQPLTLRERIFLAVAAAFALLSAVLGILLFIAAGTAGQVSPDLTTEPIAPSADVSTLLAIPTAKVVTSEYQRSAFGQAWLDVDRNGCDTRNDILGRDLKSPVFKEGTRDCKVLSGILADPYTGIDIDFVSGETTSAVVQIDHIVPLSWAWRHGAFAWTTTQREIFANDPANLLAVDGAENMAKSDSGPAQWLPSDTNYWCTYVETFVDLVASYQLTIDEADRAMALGVLTRC